jgi:hypothetical protein
MTGSPKKPKPIPKVTPFMNIYDVRKKDPAKRGTTRVARRSRCTSRGNGFVGDRALDYQQIVHMRVGDFERNSLSYSLPGIRNVSDGVHDRPHFGPHSRLHRNLRLVRLFGSGSNTGRRLLCHSGACCNCGRVWDRVMRSSVVCWRLALGVLSSRTAQCDRCDTREEIAGFLFDSLAFVILRGSGGTIVASKNACLRLLHSACFGVYERERCGRKEKDSGLWRHDQSNSDGT